MNFHRSFTGVFVTALLLMTVFAACIDDGCKDRTCMNNGVCVDGNCACPSGYESLDCSMVWSSKFCGSWNNYRVRVDSAEVADTLTYQLSVRAGAAANIFLIDSLEDIGDSIVCMIGGVNDFKINTQYNKDSSLYIESGSGQLDAATGKVSATCKLRIGTKKYSVLMQWSR